MAEDRDIVFVPDSAHMPDWPAPQGKISFNELFNFYSTGVSQKVDEGEPPLTLGFVENREGFSRRINDFGYVRQDFNLKKAGTLEHTVPNEYCQFIPLLTQIAAYEAEHNPYFSHVEGNVTVRQSNVKRGDCQISQDWHPDAGKPSENVFTHAHVYLVSDVLPTLCQKVRIPFARAALSRASSAKNPDLIYTPESYEIDLLSDLTYHKPQKAGRSCFRTFVRVIYYGVHKDSLAEFGMPPGLGEALREQGLKP
jgi:hypothetical protein